MPNFTSQATGRKARAVNKAKSHTHLNWYFELRPLKVPPAVTLNTVSSSSSGKRKGENLQPFPQPSPDEFKIMPREIYLFHPPEPSCLASSEIQSKLPGAA